MSWSQKLSQGGNRLPSLWGNPERDRFVTSLSHDRENLILLDVAAPPPRNKEAQMIQLRFFKGAFAWLLLGAGLFAGLLQTAEAQRGGRGPRTVVRGEIVSFDGRTLAIKTKSGKTTRVTVPKRARVSSLSRASFADIEKGDFVASAGQRQRDGTLHAVEVRIFPEQLRGRGEGHRPFRGGPNSTMTNATVDAIVGSVSDRTLKVKYRDGEKTIVVPKETPVMRQEVADKSLLKPGAHASVLARKGSGGQLTAIRISVGKDGLVPPI